jgi:LCP family protein required for cell wall assembly
MSATPPPSGRAQVPGSSEPDDNRPAGRASVPIGRSSQVYGAGARVAKPSRFSARSGSAGDAPLVPGGKPKRKIKPRWDRIALVSVLALLLLGGLIGGGIYLYLNHVNSKVKRIDAFSQITGNRPPVLVKGAQNILLLGSDSRDPSDAANNGGWRSDTIILMHIDADHKHAYLVSIPRDTYVFVPKSQTSPYGNTMAKINAAFSWGGVPLTVQTVEGFTGVHIDHVVLINFDGFKEVTDALGGVDMYVDQTIKSIHKPYRTFTKGNHHFTGAQALDYVRQRYQYSDGDFRRVKHQQEFLKAVMDKAASTGTLTNPAKLNAFINAMTKAIVVDKQLSIVDMAVQFRSLRSNDMTFLTCPTTGTATRDGQSVVLADKAKASALFDAVSKDTVAAWVAANPKP